MTSYVSACLSCFGVPPATNDDYVSHDGENRARAAWKTRWQALVQNVQGQLKGKGAHSPRDDVFHCLLRLYAHDDEHAADTIRRLYSAAEGAPSSVRFFIPEISNFLLHGRMHRAERLEIFLLDKTERSLHFAHRLWFFLNSHAPGHPYSSELCGAIAFDSGVLHGHGPLIRAVEVQGAIAAARLQREMSLLEPRLLPLPVPVARHLLSSSEEQPATAQSTAAHGVGAASAAPPATTAAAAPPPPPVPARLSRRGPPAPLSTALTVELDTGSTAALHRIRANLAAAEQATAHAVSIAALSASSSSEGTAAASAAAPGTGPTPVRLLASTPSTASTAATLASPQRPLMKALGPPSAAVLQSAGPLAPAGGAASTLAIGAGGFAAFFELITFVQEFARISSKLITVPIPERNGELRASLQALADRSLPSRSLYMPLGNVHHRLLAVHADHSFCFKTAKRAPFLVVLEVLDYATTSGRPLDVDDSEDDDIGRDRARHRREAAARAAARVRRDARRARMQEARHRAATLHGPGGAVSAGAAAMTVLKEGVADAADRIGDLSSQLGEVLQDRAEVLKERAGALGTYVLRKVDAVIDRNSAVGAGGGVTAAARAGVAVDMSHLGAAYAATSSAVQGGGGVLHSPQQLMSGGIPPPLPSRRGRRTASGGAGAGAGAGTGLSRAETQALADGDYALMGGGEEEAEALSAPAVSEASGTPLVSPDSRARSHARSSTAGATATAVDRFSANNRFPPPRRGGKHGRQSSGSHGEAETLLGYNSAGIGDLDAKSLRVVARDRQSFRALTRRAQLLKVRSLRRPLMASEDDAGSGVGAGGTASDSEQASLPALLAAELRDAAAETIRSLKASNASGNGDGAATTKRLPRAKKGRRDRVFSEDDAALAADLEATHNVWASDKPAAAAAAAAIQEAQEANAARSISRSSMRAASYGTIEPSPPKATALPPAAIRAPSPSADGSTGAGGGGGDPDFKAGASSSSSGEGVAAMGQWRGTMGSTTGESGGMGTPAAPAYAPPSVITAPTPRPALQPFLTPTATPSFSAGAFSTTGSTPQVQGAATVSVIIEQAGSGEEDEVDRELEQQSRAALTLRADIDPDADPAAAAAAAAAAAQRAGGTGAGAGAGAGAGKQRERRHITATAIARPGAGAGAGAADGGKAAAETEVESEGDGDDDDEDEDADAAASRPLTRTAGASAGTATAEGGDGAGAAHGGAGAGAGANGFAAVPSASASSPHAPPLTVVFPERWREKEARIAAISPWSSLPGWRLMPVIVKSHDDLRQEQFVSHLLFEFSHIFRDCRVPVWIKPYDILAISPDAGLIQAIPDTISLDSLKRGDPGFTTLNNWFRSHFGWGELGEDRLAAARYNFCKSMAGYAIVCYILQIKDRHNGNILLDRRGHIMHIDFGFLLTNSPGGNIGFESAPFKLTAEMLGVLGGVGSPLYSAFRSLTARAFLAARKYSERIILLVEMMLSGNEHLPCFRGGKRVVMEQLRARFRSDLSDRACVAWVHSLIDDSVDNWRTRWYDAYQQWAQGVAS